MNEKDLVLGVECRFSDPKILEAMRERDEQMRAAIKEFVQTGDVEPLRVFFGVEEVV